jgi:hypothetical protein
MTPAKRKAPVLSGADATTKTNQLPTKVVETKYSGKVRPGVREPDHTHYGCSCCRWSA